MTKELADKLDGLLDSLSPSAMWLNNMRRQRDSSDALIRLVEALRDCSEELPEENRIRVAWDLFEATR